MKVWIVIFASLLVTTACEEATSRPETLDRCGSTSRIIAVCTARLEASETELLFESTEPGSEERQFVRLTNVGVGVARLNSIMLEDPSGRFARGETWQDHAELETGETLELKVIYTHSEENTRNGRIVIESNDPDSPVRTIELRHAKTPENRCPVAIAKGGISGQNPSSEVRVAPLETVKLYGDESYDPDGDMLTHKWRVASRPQTSTASVKADRLPSSSAFIDVAGTYVFELKVVDEHGVESCEASDVTVVSACACDIHVQLVWDNPADEDQTDDMGANLDLHYAQKGAAWHDPLLDVHPENMGPDWGAEGPADDPSLDVDDTDGAGPENVNHGPGESSADYYTVGVHYVAENGFGASYATVRIFIDGAQVYEQRDKYLGFEDQFWTVARIHWPSKEIEEIDQLSRP